MTAARIRSKITLLLFIALFLNIALWASSRFMYAAWAGVPPVPSPRGAMAMTLGDSEFAFRSGALTLQGLGDGGGRVTPLKDYDFDRLGHWFWLLNALNPASEHVPLIAAYYFGVVHDPEQVSVLVDYLTAVGQNPAGEKWRWLVQAAFLARHRMKDMDRALDIAYTLSRMKPLDAPLPIWAKEFPAFILIDTGERETARAIMENILLTEKDIPPQEVNFMTGWLYDELDVPQEEINLLLEKRKGL